MGKFWPLWQEPERPDRSRRHRQKMDIPVGHGTASTRRDGRCDSNRITLVDLGSTNGVPQRGHRLPGSARRARRRPHRFGGYTVLVIHVAGRF
ncbi:MAG: hypothetical protein R3F14_02050 [Polyangiaceae bacterium]